MNGASLLTLARRCVYGGRKARSAYRRLHERGVCLVHVGLNGGLLAAVIETTTRRHLLIGTATFNGAWLDSTKTVEVAETRRFLYAEGT